MRASISSAKLAPTSPSDTRLILALLLLASFGLVMVATSSIELAASNYSDPWYFLKKQLVFLTLGLAIGFAVTQVPLTVWMTFSNLILLLGLALLVVVLIPGIGKVVNGSRRWLSFGGLGFQASEAAKICLIIFYASFLTRRADMVTKRWVSFSIMVSVMGVTALLLLMEPDFGASFVICSTLCVMMFVARVPVIRFSLLVLFGLGCGYILITSADYRLDRLKSFLNPFADPDNTGYQLVQSLIAFGRADWFGLGLGNSIQKLAYLPDAHTDFVFAILAEEFGLVGVFAFIAAFSYTIFLMFKVVYRSFLAGKLFGAYISLGVSMMLTMQAFINIGVSTGILPTKGLTLPFVSSGGSSLTVTCVLVALVVRAQIENEAQDG